MAIAKAFGNELVVIANIFASLGQSFIASLFAYCDAAVGCAHPWLS